MEELVGLILTAGELLLTCGAEMARVEETIERMGRAAGFVQVESYATPTGLFVSLHDPQGKVYTRVKRIRGGQSNIALIAEVNSLSRAFSGRSRPRRSGGSWSACSRRARGTASPGPSLAAAGPWPLP